MPHGPAVRWCRTVIGGGGAETEAATGDCFVMFGGGRGYSGLPGIWAAPPPPRGITHGPDCSEIMPRFAQNMCNHDPKRVHGPWRGHMGKQRLAVQGTVPMREGGSNPQKATTIRWRASFCVEEVPRRAVVDGPLGVSRMTRARLPRATPPPQKVIRVLWPTPPNVPIPRGCRCLTALSASRSCRSMTRTLVPARDAAFGGAHAPRNAAGCPAYPPRAHRAVQKPTHANQMQKAARPRNTARVRVHRPHSALVCSPLRPHRPPPP